MKENDKIKIKKGIEKLKEMGVSISLKEEELSNEERELYEECEIDIIKKEPQKMEEFKKRLELSFLVYDDEENIVIKRKKLQFCLDDSSEILALKNEECLDFVVDTQYEMIKSLFTKKAIKDMFLEIIGMHSDEK